MESKKGTTLALLPFLLFVIRMLEIYIFDKDLLQFSILKIKIEDMNPFLCSSKHGRYKALENKSWTSFGEVFEIILKIFQTYTFKK